MVINLKYKLLFLIGIIMISVGGIMINNVEVSYENNNKDYKDSNNIEARKTSDLSMLNMNVGEAGVVRIEVFDGKTYEELVNQINKSLGGILAGHADIIVKRSLELGVDPYVAAAIMMHETGNGTSRIANTCYNFGGQKGSGCGAYKAYPSVDEGLVGIIDNLYRNYYAKGLTTIESIGSRYAEGSEWPSKIHSFVNKIKNA